MRTSLNHQPEVHHPKSPAIRWAADYPIFAPKSGLRCWYQAAAACSIRVASSAGAFEQLTRRDTGHFCSKSSGAGFKYSMPALPLSHGSNCSAKRRIVLPVTFRLHRPL